MRARALANRDCTTPVDAPSEPHRTLPRGADEAGMSHRRAIMLVERMPHGPLGRSPATPAPDMTSEVSMGHPNQAWVVFVQDGQRSSIHAVFADKESAHEHAENLDPEGRQRHLGAVAVKPYEVLRTAPRSKALWRISHSGAQVVTVTEYPKVEELTFYEHLHPAWFRGDQRRPRPEDQRHGVAVVGPDLDACREEFARLAAESGLDFDWEPQTRRPEAKRMPGRLPPR
jgi:hypothetical protein